MSEYTSLRDVLIEAHYDSAYKLLEKMVKFCGVEKVQKALDEIKQQDERFILSHLQAYREFDEEQARESRTDE